MIIPINNEKENHFYKICNETDEVYNQQFNNQAINSMGRPKKYTDLEIIKCKLYMIMNNIYCLRELEWKLFHDQLAVSIIGLKEVPDHSTFAIRFKKLEQEKFDKLYKTVISLLEPETRICAIDSTPLRSSKYDSEAKFGTSTRLGNYKGYKLHLVASKDALPVAFKCSTANVYDNTFDYCQQLMRSLGDYDPFILLGDAAYDSTKLFKLADQLGFKLLTD
ncbi:MAG: transposase, partial [Bacillota bacterium]